MQAWKRQRRFGVTLVREIRTRNFVSVIALRLIELALDPIGSQPPTGGIAQRDLGM